MQNVCEYDENYSTWDNCKHPLSPEDLTGLKCILFAFIPGFGYLSLPHFPVHSTYAQCACTSLHFICMDINNKTK